MLFIIEKIHVMYISCPLPTLILHMIPISNHSLEAACWFCQLPKDSSSCDSRSQFLIVQSQRVVDNFPMFDSKTALSENGLALKSCFYPHVPTSNGKTKGGIPHFQTDPNHCLWQGLVNVRFSHRPTIGDIIFNRYFFKWWQQTLQSGIFTNPNHINIVVSEYPIVSQRCSHFLTHSSQHFSWIIILICHITSFISLIHFYLHGLIVKNVKTPSKGRTNHQPTNQGVKHDDSEQRSSWPLDTRLAACPRVSKKPLVFRLLGWLKHVAKKQWINITGWWLSPTPLKNHGVRQLGWWHSQYMEKCSKPPTR